MPRPFFVSQGLAWLRFIHVDVHLSNRMGELNDVDDRIDFQTAYVAGLVKESNYSYDLDISEMLHAWNKTKLDNITTYRDQSFTSKHTGHKAPLSHTPFMEEFDDSMEHFLKTEQRNL